LWHEVEAIFAIAGACYLAISFLSYVPGRAGANAAGPSGISSPISSSRRSASRRFSCRRSSRSWRRWCCADCDRAVDGARRRAHRAAAADRDDPRAAARPGRESAAGGWVGGFFAFELRGLFSTAGAVMIVLTGLS